MFAAVKRIAAGKEIEMVMGTRMPAARPAIGTVGQNVGIQCLDYRSDGLRRPWYSYVRNSARGRGAGQDATRPRRRRSGAGCTEPGTLGADSEQKDCPRWSRFAASPRAFERVNRRDVEVHHDSTSNGNTGPAIRAAFHGVDPSVTF